MRSAPLHEAETALIERRCRETGTRVMLIYSWEADPTQPWETVCVDHGTVCSHETRALAERFLSHPTEWCEVCMAADVPRCGCGEPEDGGEFGWFTAANGLTYCNACGSEVDG